MKIKKGFVLRTVMGTPVIVAEGQNAQKFNKLVSLNSTAAFVWEKFLGQDFSAGDVADALVEEYEIDRDTARKDAEMLLGKWAEIGVAE